MSLITGESGNRHLIDIDSCDDVLELRAELKRLHSQIAELKDELYQNKVSLRYVNAMESENKKLRSELCWCEQRNVKLGEENEEENKFLREVIAELYPTTWRGKLKLLFRKID